MFRELYLTVLFGAICLAMPIFDSLAMEDNNELRNIRVKRYDPFSAYNPYLSSLPYTYKLKTPFFKVKVNSGYPNNGFANHPLHGINDNSFYPYANNVHHSLVNLPHMPHYPYGYGWGR
ncbi:hypothetical protein WUBG_01368 [Wuchereria bancrofti]|uniref:Uncharacterized protein n=1 Tax=Wuchereria bancrofti TaxID=6293 RepID=J9FK45_WUCBA|nr:hypothetical protein WUBG_01368 [Wuchereria bancrofti]